MANISLSNQQTYNERLNKAFGETVTAWRNKRGFNSQREFARIVGISNSHLRKIEGGEVSPRLNTIAKIAEVLEVEAGVLVYEATQRAAGKPADSYFGIGKRPDVKLNLYDGPSRIDYHVVRF